MVGRFSVSHLRPSTAFAVLAYVILDGFDLGVGILFPLFPKKADRDQMMNPSPRSGTVNETRLVLGGGGLMAVFPLAYATILPALYAPLIAMGLLGLIFAASPSKYRWRTRRAEHLWNWAFAGGSTVAASRKAALGALVQGIPVENRAHAGGWWDWFTPFSMATGVALVLGYALPGATWLVMKTRGELAEKARRLAYGGRCCHGCRHGRLQPLDAMAGAALCRALVRLSDGDLLGDRAASRARLPLSHPQRSALGKDIQPFVAALGLFSLPYRDRYQLLSLYRPDLAHHLGCSGTRFQPCLPVGRGGGSGAPIILALRTGLAPIGCSGGKIDPMRAITDGRNLTPQTAWLVCRPVVRA